MKPRPRVTVGFGAKSGRQRFNSVSGGLYYHLLADGEREEGAGAAVSFLSGALIGDVAGGERGETFEFCSRILALQETSELELGTAPQTFGASPADPIGCINRDESLGPKDGFQVSSCQQSSVKLKGLKSVFALKLELDDRKGTLQAFESSTKEKSICFQHNVPMGESEFADDSPRCFSGDGGMLVMFVTKTCPEALEGCVNNWLLASEGKCDGTGSPKSKQEKQADTKLASEPVVPEPSKTPKTPAPPRPRKPSPKPALPPVDPVPPPGAGADPMISLPPQSASPPATLPGPQQTGPGPSQFTVPPPTTAPLIPSGLPGDITLPPGGGLSPQLPEDQPLPGPGGIPGPSTQPGNINPNSPQFPGPFPGGPVIPPGAGSGSGVLPEDTAPGGQIPPGQAQGIIPPEGAPNGVSMGVPELAPGTGGGAPVPPSIQNPAGGVDKELAIDLCFRVYSTTHLVDRTTCTGFGPSYEDPIRCIEDAQAFNPDMGIAYTPCADLRARLSPGDTKPLFNMTIGDRPGMITAKLSESVDEPRPVCIFVQVEGDGEFPEEDEAGCMHPWEPVSMFIGKTCRTKTACSYHSLMVAGGGCLAPRTLPERELEDLPEREGDLVAGFGEIGSEERYETPDGLVSQWIRCPVAPGENAEVMETPEEEIEIDETEEKIEIDETEEETIEAPTIKSKRPKRKRTTKAAPKSSKRKSVVQLKTEEEPVEEPENSPGPVIASTGPIITSRSNVPASRKKKGEEEDD
ncbi:hypothetical protein BSKO_13162 [Bryopsis sp. KO-2023]|nr:hypothetical protein BSKO_13162 [Bryopsis sp. KO-2023]